MNLGFPAVDLNLLKEEMISPCETSVKFRSSEDVLAAPYVLADASFKIALSFLPDESGRVYDKPDSFVEI
jgi:hypothetical protein